MSLLQMRVLLTALKRKGDAAIPSRRADIVSRLTIAERREPLVEERAVIQQSSSVADILSTNEDKVNKESDSEEELVLAAEI